MISNQSVARYRKHQDHSSLGDEQKATRPTNQSVETDVVSVEASSVGPRPDILNPGSETACAASQSLNWTLKWVGGRDQ